MNASRYQQKLKPVFGGEGLSQQRYHDRERIRRIDGHVAEYEFQHQTADRCRYRPSGRNDSKLPDGHSQQLRPGASSYPRIVHQIPQILAPVRHPSHDKALHHRKSRFPLFLLKNTDINTDSPAKMHFRKTISRSGCD